MAEIVLTDAQVRAVLEHWSVKSHKTTAAILAVRDADGDGNALGIFDDKFYVATKTGATPFKGNTDPTKIVDGTAQLESGQVVTYRAGKHKLDYPAPRGYPAFRQYGRAHVRREGVGRELDNIAANIHHGTLSGGTSSEACQTVPIGLWDAFRGKMYAALGVTDADVLLHPAGVGPTFEYLLLDRAQVESAVAGAERAPAPSVTQRDRAAALEYLLRGKALTGVQMVVGVGFAPTRTTLARLTGLAPEKLAFRRADGADPDTRPDLVWLAPSGHEHSIDTLDGPTNPTLGRITDMARAAGYAWVQGKADHTVTLTKG